MQISKAARRYSSTFLQVAREEDLVEEVMEDLQFIRNTLDDSRELILFLRSPIVKKSDKAEVIEELFKDHVRETTFMFLKLMIQKNREALLHEITEAYTEQYNKYAGIQPVYIHTAYELSDEQKKQLTEALEEYTGMTVESHYHIDKSLKGGVAVRIEDTVIDGTVRYKLDKLEKRFMRPTG